MKVEHPCSDARVVVGSVVCPLSIHQVSSALPLANRLFLVTHLPGAPQTNTRAHTHTCTHRCPAVCLCSHERKSSMKKPIRNESMDRSKYFLFMASLGLLVLWTYWLNCFLAMTRYCLLAPVIDGVVPRWLPSREIEISCCSPLRHMWPCHPVANPYVFLKLMSIHDSI